MDESEAATANPSALATFLKQQWAWGRFSPHEIQHLAMLARQDMRSSGCSGVPSALSALSDMGTCGQYSNNVHRDLMTLVKDDSLLPEPFYVSFPYKLQDVVQAVMSWFLIVCGHTIANTGSHFFCLEELVDW